MCWNMMQFCFSALRKCLLQMCGFCKIFILHCMCMYIHCFVFVFLQCCCFEQGRNRFPEHSSAHCAKYRVYEVLPGENVARINVKKRCGHSSRRDVKWTRFLKDKLVENVKHPLRAELYRFFFLFSAQAAVCTAACVVEDVCFELPPFPSCPSLASTYGEQAVGFQPTTTSVCGLCDAP